MAMTESAVRASKAPDYRRRSSGSEGIHHEPVGIAGVEQAWRRQLAATAERGSVQIRSRLVERTQLPD
jgi:hypothetical protein